MKWLLTILLFLTIICVSGCFFRYFSDMTKIELGTTYSPKEYAQTESSKIE